MVALALVLSFVERLIPVPAPVPGIKLGLANLVVVVALYLFGWKEAAMVSALRVLLGGALFGSGFSIVYALVGSICSFIVMLGAKKAALYVVTVSAMGGLVHNLAQLAVASLVVRTPEVMYYLPLLAISGIGTGVLIGVSGNALIGRLNPLV